MLVIDAGALVSIILGILAGMNVLYASRHTLTNKLRARRVELERQASITPPVKVNFNELFLD